MLQIIFHTVLCAAISLNEPFLALSDRNLLNEQWYKKCREDSLNAEKCLIRVL